MAVQMTINKKNKANMAARESEEVHPVNMSMCPLCRSECCSCRRGSDACAADGTFAPMGLEDGADVLELDDKRIVGRVYELIKEKHEKKENYFNLAMFCLFVILYLTVLYLQLNTYRTYLVNSSFNSLLPQGGQGYVTSPAEIYDYLNQTIITPLWADPVCGDGICESPFEFAGFGRFGCTPDCGPMPSVAVTLQLDTAFDSVADRKASHWNLCMTSPTILCWYAEDQLFSDQTGTIIKTLNLPNGTWEMVLTSPGRGLSGAVKAARMDGEGVPGSDGLQTLTSWGSCLPDDQSDLNRCRSICAEAVTCAVNACVNLVESQIPPLYIDCTSNCNQNVTIMDTYQSLPCVEAALKAGSLSDSFLGVNGLNCTLDPAYPATNPLHVAFINKTTAAAAPPGVANTTHFKGGSARRLNQATTLEFLSANATQLYWNKFGSTDKQRYSTLATALARALATWAIDTCLCPYSFKPAKTGPPMLGFLCAFFGGPLTLEGCAYRDPRSGQNLTSADFPQLQAILATRYGPSGTFGNVSQAEQDRFISILVNAIVSTIAFDFGADDVLSFQARLHTTDAAVVALPGDRCNKAKVSLPWKQNVHHTTNITVGDSVQWVWRDDLPHALASTNVPDNESIFQSVGAGRQLITRTTVCTPENILSAEDGTFTEAPVPCIVGTTNAGNVPGRFSYTKIFNTPGRFAYVDTHFPSSMLGVVNVNNYVPPSESNASTNPSTYECAPSCKIGSLQNGLCDPQCNNFDCAFDGGDCSCPDPSMVTGSLLPGAAPALDTCLCPGHQIRNVDGSCCQAQAIGDGLQLPFDVVLSNQAAVPPIDDGDFTRKRYASNHNRIIGGLLLYQTRFESRQCPERKFSAISGSCVGSGLSTAPFGADPVFIPTSVLNNPKVNLADYYKANELSPLGIPYGFFSHETLGEDPGFPIVFDINLSQYHAQERLRYLQDGLFIDNGTNVLIVRLLTYNGDERRFATFSAYFTFQKGGTIAINSEVSAVNAEPYVTPLDYFRASLEIILAAAVLYNIYLEIREARGIWRNTGSILNYFHFYNIVDVLSIALMIGAIAIWITFVCTQALHFNASVRYDIYNSLIGDARFFGFKTPSQYNDFARIVGEVSDIVLYSQVYAAVNGLNIFFLIIRMLKHLHFQPKMGIITKSLALAGHDLLNFFVLWSIFIVGYAFMGFLTFGRSVEYFRNIQWSLTSCFLIILGDTSVEYQLMQLDGWELAASQLFYYSYNIGMVTIIMQFLVAIAVDAFSEIKDRTPDNAAFLLEDLADISKDCFERIFRNKRYSDNKLLTKLENWRGAVLDDDAEESNVLECKAWQKVPDELEKKMVLKLEDVEVDKEKLETVFERRCKSPEEVTPEVSKIADQILAEFGEEVLQKKKKKEDYPNLKKDMRQLKCEMAMLRDMVTELTETLHWRFDDVKQDMALAGIRRPLTREGQERESLDGLPRATSLGHTSLRL